MTVLVSPFLSHARTSWVLALGSVPILGDAGDGLDTSWLVFGLAAEAMIAVCIGAQWLATHRAGRFVMSPWMIYLGIAATFMLAGVAWFQQQWLFLLSQLLCVLIGLRLLGWFRERSLPPPQKSEASKLPVVAPDSAELKLPRKEPPSGIAPPTRVKDKTAVK